MLLKKHRTKAMEKTWSEETIFSSFFPGKFSPPRIDPEFHLLRPKALAPLTNPQHNIVSIEASAGQGKSVLAAQFLHHIKSDFAWLQLDESDRDPVVFIAAVIAALTKAFPGLGKSILYQMFLKNEVSSKEAEYLAPTLLMDLNPFLKETFYFVIDDLHLLKESEQAFAFLDSLMAEAPLKLHFILISRNSMEFKAASARVFRMGNESLALSQADVAELFSKIFKMPQPAQTVSELHQSTEGWIMGVILASHSLTNHYTFKPFAKLQSDIVAQPQKIWNYFNSEILASLAPPQRNALLCLALLQDIPLELAQTLSLMPDMDVFLEHLVRKNYFLRRLEENPPIYCFHHLFKEFLRYQASVEISPKNKRILYARCGQWFLSQNRYELALHYYLESQAFGMVEKIFRNVGMQLLGANRIDTLQEAVKIIPPDIANSKPWLSLISAAIYSSDDPPRSKAFLDQAYEKFRSKGDKVGELLTAAGLMTYHIGVDCDFKRGEMLLPRAESLYAELEKQLATAARIQIASAISYGLCYFVGQFERAARYNRRMIQLAKDQNLYDAMALGVMTEGLIGSFSGDWQNFKNLIEASLRLLQSPRVNRINKLSLIALQINLLANEGDLTPFKYYRQMIDTWINPKLLFNTFFGSMLINLEASIAIAEGRLEDAKSSLQKGLESAGSSQSSHMQSQYLARLAYIYALSGESKKALEALDLSSQLRRQVGGTYFVISTTIVAGCIHALLGNYKNAEDLLSSAISQTAAIGPVSIVILAYAHRAYIRIRTGCTSKALEDIEQFIKKLKHYHIPYLHAFNPALLHELLTVALVHGIETEDAILIGQKLLHMVIRPDGRHIPLLEITTLGGLGIKISNVTRIRFEDLTKTQRELLALLIATSSSQGVSLTTVQETFWPESDPEKVRSKIDNLFSRLRKVFNECLTPYPAGDYLLMDKGYMRLTNVLIDAKTFKKDVQLGIRHMQKMEFYQALNALLRSYSIYKGEFLPGIHLNDPAAYFRENLQEDFTECALYLAGMLSGAARFTEAVQICQKALSYDPINESIVRLLRDLFARNNDAVQAKKVITNYRNSLRDEGFSNDDIEEIIASF